MKIDLNRYASAFKTLPQGVREAEVNGVLDEELSVEIRDGSIVGSKSLRRTRLYVRASGEKTGTVCTEKLDEDPYDVIARAIANSAYSSAEGTEIMNEGGDPLWMIDEVSSTGAQDLLAFGSALERKALSSAEVASMDRCTVRKSGYATRTINSKGLDAYGDNTFFTVDLHVSLKRSGKLVTASVTRSARKLPQLEPDRLVALAIAHGNQKDGAGTLQPCSVASGTYPAVLTNQVVCNIMQMAWLEFAGERMQNGTSIFPEKAGTPVGSSLLNVTSAPGHTLVGHYSPIDHEGSVCREIAVVKDGKLVSPLYTLGSAAQAAKASTGSAGRVAMMTGTMPISITTVPAVIYIEPGDRTQQELIAEMGDGLFLTYALDTFHAINLTSGEFSIPCGGVSYRGGKPVGTVSQMIMAGNLRDLFGNISAVGDDLLFEEFYFKNYSYGGPSLLVTGLKFGT